MYLQNILSKIYSYLPKVDGQSIRQEFKHAFSVGTSHENKTLSEKELAVILKLVAVIQKENLRSRLRCFLNVRTRSIILEAR